jgi:hypothetical protein
MSACKASLLRLQNLNVSYMAAKLYAASFAPYFKLGKEMKGR